MSKQKPLFPAGDDLPLFSGAPQQAEQEQFVKRPVRQRTGLFVCGFCHDTGIIVDRKRGRAVQPKFFYCHCPAGQQAREAAREAANDLSS